MWIEPKNQGVGIAFSDPHHALAQELATVHRTQREDTAAKRWERRAGEQVSQSVQQILVRLKLDFEAFA